MKNLSVGLVGNPNSGKTTVFNALTGARQRVGNWPGVTVERKSGFFKQQQTTIEVIDLPGIYSLTSASLTSLDEHIACDFILNQQADVIINVVDANSLERNLYLTVQLLEMQVPMIVAVNMMDVAQRRHTAILIHQLEQALGCPVIALEAHRGKGINELKKRVINRDLGFSQDAKNKKNGMMPDLINQAILAIAQELNHPNAHWLAERLLEDDLFAREKVGAAFSELSVSTWQQRIRTALHEDADILLADTRYRFIHDIVTRCVQKTNCGSATWTARLDRIVLHKIMGIPFFLGVMYCLFLFAINIGGAFQDFFDISSQTLFVHGLAKILAEINSPSWMIALLANGVGKGISTTFTFIPVIGAMFLGLAFLEDSGYMARAAFVVDRLMCSLGLPGKAFVPMIVGFGCNVPAVMAARTLENRRDRILTVMMSPFMSCGARLAIYAVFTAAFFKVGGHSIVFLLYVIGIVMAMLTGLLLRSTVLKGEPAPLLMELPPYHAPRLGALLLQASQRLKSFVLRAGKLIIPICVILGVLNTINIDGSINSGKGDTHSLLSIVGLGITPLFSPMGIHQDNWPATVGLITGVLAKEVVIGTLNTLYSQLGQLNIQVEAFHFWENLQAALLSIPLNFSQLGQSLSNPVLAKAPIHTLSQGVYGIMVERFDGRIGAIAYLLFVLLYFPCISTTAAMVRELNRAWAVGSALWMTIVAYGVAVGFYQAATFSRHPLSSFIWLISILCVFLLVGLGMRMLVPIRTSILKRGPYEFARH